MGKLTFGQTGLSYEVDKVEINVQGAPKCPRCDTRVYFNEEKKALGKTWHVRCFNCSRCNKSLGSTTNYNQLNDELLCAPCYKRSDPLKPVPFDPTCYSSTADRPSQSRSSIAEQPGDIWVNQVSQRSSGQYDYVTSERAGASYAGALQDPDRGGYTEMWVNSTGVSSQGSSPSRGSREELRGAGWAPTAQGAPTRGSDWGGQRGSEDGGLAEGWSSRTHSGLTDPTSSLFSQGFTPVGGVEGGAGGAVYPTGGQRGAQASARFRVTGGTTGVDRNHQENCPHCGKRVYFAEEIKVLKRKWHKLCFKCVTCSKTLEPGRFNEHDDSLYCQTCYGKQFGPQGYGFAGGVGGHVMSAETYSRPSRPSASLYEAGELARGPGAPYDSLSVPRGSGSRGSGSLSPGYATGTEEGFGEARTLHKTEPIKGTSEWTEAVFIR